MAMTNTQAIESAQSRMQIYTALAEIFLQLPILENIKDQASLINALLNEDENEAVVDNYGAIEAIKQEYYDLFFVPMSGLYIPPYESALLEYNVAKKRPYGQLFGSAARHVQACYEDVGFNYQELNIFEPLKDITFPDHIGFELAFMGLLCLAEKSALEKEEEAGLTEAKGWVELQSQFLDEHLSKWVSNLAKAIKNNSNGFYAKAALATASWIDEELSYLNSQAFRGEDMA